MRTEAIHNVYFIGIGGIGMSGLARYFRSAGKNVMGYDRTETELTDALQAEGISVHFNDDVAHIPPHFKPENTLVVYTPAVPGSHTELCWFREQGFEVHKRAYVLGLITRDQFTVAVAGTHGKTTTSTIIAHLLEHSGLHCNAFLGGIATNYNSNVILNAASRTTVAEADEYDRSFLQLHPNIAVITSMEPDHLDIYGSGDKLMESFQLFADLATDGKLFAHDGLPVQHPHKTTYNGPQAAFSASDVKVSDGFFVFNAQTPKGVIPEIRFPMPGRHNISNALAGIAVAQEMGIDNQSIKLALESFKGVKRRFEFKIREPHLVFIDDYAHHPSELNACIGAVKELYPNKKITGVFQPHLYSRTRDFAEGFAQSLSALNEVILLDIYPAREQPIEGINSGMLLENITAASKELIGKKELVESMGDRELEVVLTLGAGDIDQLVEPIKTTLLKRLS